MAWKVTAVCTKRDGTYTGVGSRGRQLVRVFADQPTAHRWAQTMTLPDTRWAYATVEEVSDG